jgi:hypothetical protein
MKFLERFVLSIPYPFLKNISYAWLGAVLIWNWSPLFSGILMAIVLLGLLMMAWQKQAWEARIIREFHSAETKPILDHPHAARLFQVRNLMLMLVGCAGLGWLLNEQLGIPGVQWFLLSAGFMLLDRDGMLFGAAVLYIVTNQGIGIRYVPGHLDYRLFFKFNEIKKAVRTKVPESLPMRWDVLTPRRNLKEGVLLFAASRTGFTKLIQGELLLSPTDIEGFLDQLSPHVWVPEEAFPSSG